MASQTGSENRRIHGYLKRLFGDSTNSIIPLINPRYTIGRDPRSSIHLDDVNISRKHCVLNLSRDGWIITDCGGVNGTYLNSKKLKHSTPTLLKDGLTIFLGVPSVSNVGFVFLKTLDTPSAASESGASSRPVLGDIEKFSYKRPNASGEENLKRFKKYHAFLDTPEHSQMCVTSDPKPGPSSFKDIISLKIERKFYGILKGTETDPGPSCSGTQTRDHLAMGVDVPGSSGPRLLFPDAGGADDPGNLSSDGGNVSDCSISSLDSLKTRIRKNQKRESRNISRSLCMEEGTTKELLPNGELNDLGSLAKLWTSRKVAVDEKKEKKDLQVDEVESTSTFQQDSDIEPSESLLPEMCSQSENEEKPNKKSSSEAQASDSEATITYLKERVLKLQHQLLEANLKMTKVSEDNRKHEKLIQSLEANQGISQEQLMSVLEDELACNICTEILIKPVTLNCAHTFCKHCISVWKKKKKQCPMCREPIKTEMGILVLENLITKAVAHLDKPYQTRRTELVQGRIDGLAEKKQKMKRRRARRSQVRSQRITNDFIVTSANSAVEQSLQLSGIGRIQMVPVNTVSPAARDNSPYPTGIEILLSDGSDTSVEGSGYYGGFGRCYNCGRRGHWANGCPGF